MSVGKHILRFTLLGTGSSGCDPNEPKNRRSRCGAMVERFAETEGGEPTRLLIDASSDLREQMLRTKTGRIDGVLFTHDHADQTGGIDELRVFAIRQRARIPVHMDAETAKTLTVRARYCFEGEGDYPAILDMQPFLKPHIPVCVDGVSGPITIMPLQQLHGRIGSLGFRIGSLAYCNDVSVLPPETLKALEGVEVFIVDALRHIPHPSHATVEQALDWARRISPAKTILTNMHVDLDYQTLRRELPKGVVPGYDGLTIDFTT